MSRKRRNTSSAEPDDSPSPKRQRSSPASRDRYDRPSRHEPERSKVDAVYGMAGAFPGLDASDELFYGPANDGLEYLRMVRSEARGVPLLLHAPRDDPLNKSGEEGEDDWEEDGGYYEDGAFVALPIQDTLNHSGPGRVQALHYLSLLRRYRKLQAKLNTTPPLSAIELLASSQPISFPPNSKNARMKWREILRTKQPHPTQVACMEAESVLAMVGLLADCMSEVLKSGTTRTVGLFGSWAWAILGKCKDVTELGSEEVSELRRLGRKAADLMEMSRSTPDADGEEHDSWDRADETMSIIDESSYEPSHVTDNDAEEATALEGLKSRLSEKLGHEEGSEEAVEGQGLKEEKANEVALTVIILDMIITVVGEVYGQRDLLRFRHLWKSENPDLVVE